MYSCSGYGGRSCFQCYSGRLCKTREDPVTCELASTGGNPLVIAQFWLNSSSQEPCSTTLAHYRWEWKWRSQDGSRCRNTMFPSRVFFTLQTSLSARHWWASLSTEGCHLKTPFHGMCMWMDRVTTHIRSLMQSMYMSVRWLSFYRLVMQIQKADS